MGFRGLFPSNLDDVILKAAPATGPRHNLHALDNECAGTSASVADTGASDGGVVLLEDVNEGSDDSGGGEGGCGGGE